jgi:FMN reductase
VANPLPCSHPKKVVVRVKVRVSVVVGNPKPKSRTLAVGVAVAEALFAPEARDIRIVDLVDHADELFRWPSETLAELNADVAASDVVILGSPTYKATYTGLLKAFLDRYPANGLDGTVAIPFQTGADETHSLGPQHGLVPLLTELGAVVPGGGFYFVTSRMNSLDAEAQELAARYGAAIRRVGALSPALAGAEVPA